MVSEILAYAMVVLTWGAVLYKLPVIRKGAKDPAQRAYVLTLLFLAFSMTVLLTPVYITVDRFTRIPNLARLLGNGFGLAGG